MLLTFIKLRFVVKIFILSILAVLHRFTVYAYCDSLLIICLQAVSMNLGKDKIKNITKEEALLNKEIEV